MGIARFALQNWYYFVGAGAVLFGVSWILYELPQALGHRPALQRRWERYWQERNAQPWTAVRASAIVGSLLWLLVGAALTTSLVADIRYWATQPPRPTWPDLQLSLDASPMTGAFTEGQEIDLRIRAVNESDTPVILETIKLGITEGIVPDSVHATRPVTETVRSSDILWTVDAALERGGEWEISIPLRLAAPGTRQGWLTAFVSAGRSFEQVLWDVKNIRPQGAATLFTEGQATTFQVPIAWTVVRK